jgi:hypothetical protein
MHRSRSEVKARVSAVMLFTGTKWMSLRPLTKVPTGQPVTPTPSWGVRPLQAMLHSRAGPALVRSTILD